MKRTFIIGLLLASATAFAYPGPNGGPRDDMRMPFESLNLTAKQKQQIKSIQREAREERFKLVDQLDDLRDETRERVMAVLSDEQKKALAEQRKAMLQKHPKQNCNRSNMPDRAKMPMKNPQRD